jgi:serine/threonine protein kinase
LFLQANWVGTGGFGLVYRGVLPVMHCPEKVRGKKPSQDIEVAVKVLDVDTSLSDSRFKSQMDLLGRLKHKYLVSGVNGTSVFSSERSMRVRAIMKTSFMPLLDTKLVSQP